MRRADIQTSKTFASSLVQILAFGADIEIVGRTEASVHEAYQKLREEAAKIGLVINETKTRFMMINIPEGR